MDQYINIFGQAKKVIKIDCRSLDYEYFPFERTDLRIVLADTTVRRALATSEYNIRRKQCEEGVAILYNTFPFVQSLRDADLSMLVEHQRVMDPLVYRRCKYVIEENIRVCKACEDLQKNDFTSFGERMFASHAGLRDEYEVSCRELDLLVDIASSLDGVYGSRMMGAGFGGCTINLVEADAIEDFSSAIRERYIHAAGTEPKIHVSTIQTGTNALVSNPSYV
jgi:galactokinase